MPIGFLYEKRTIAVAAVSICASAVAAYSWIKSNKTPKKSVNLTNCKTSLLSNSCIDLSSTSDEQNIEMMDVMDVRRDYSSNQMLNSSNITTSSPLHLRGGRKNYRAMKKDSSPPLSNNSSVKKVSVTVSDAEERAERLALEFSARINMPESQTSEPSTSGQGEEHARKLSVYESFTNAVQVGDSTSTIEESASLNGNVTFYPTNTTVIDVQAAESPSLTCDGRSEGSQDSGKGPSVAPTSSVSPADESNIETPLVYEFEIPQSIVGLVIGRQGITIKQFTERSGAQMIIRQHFSTGTGKICTIEGHREQINNCLRLIRRKFPPSRFPELKLTPVMPPPIVYPVSPIVDSIVRLNLPDGIKCEVVVSSLIEPGHFFVQQPTHPSFTSLARLDQYMLAVYNQTNGVPSLPRPIEDGVICAAPVMDGWFRAQTVEKYDENDEVLVKFVDYGGYLRIGAADLRQIRSDFMTLPFQAIECTLANVKPINESEGWTPESVSFFESCIYGKIIDTLVVSHSMSDDVVRVELYFPYDDENGQRNFASISKALVDNGFACWID